MPISIEDVNTQDLKKLEELSEFLSATFSGASINGLEVDSANEALKRVVSQVKALKSGRAG